MGSMPPFLGRQGDTEQAKFWIISAPTDESARVIRGQSAAPASILSASVYIEPHDEEAANVPTYTHPVYTVEDPIAGNENIKAKAVEAIDAKAVPIILGGDPSVSIAGIRAVSEKTDNFTILHIGARPQLKDEVNGNNEASDCVMRRALECSNLKKIVQVGVSTLSDHESEALFNEDSKIEPFFSCDLAKSEDDSWHEDVIQELSSPVYLSFDLSAFSRSVMPSVGCPEPGGMDWWEVMRLLKKVTSRRRIAGFDLTDLVPIEGDLNGDYASAKLCHKMMAYIVSSGKMF
jgi:agmatinase